ncbi:exported hypothetical protein [Nitrospina gracilis 3/211]|uniref:Uncharacterized protein n=1 Tax=Nitrospina gracilis (strain 3/211) TaxID=1266370 RepID=M1YHZ5_NITG3|nr:MULTISPECIES: hypothetical protein [Nitrospina]MCF8723078.1 hypothetical protein [Nitrospina sp. Nb-3]CCQ90115.1 exported hypothetical protein [Nitrospina gracilis 3/211]
MKLIWKLNLLILLFGFGIGAVGFFLFDSSQQVFEERAGQEVLGLAQDQIEILNQMLSNRIEEVERIASGKDLVQLAEESNAFFSARKDVEQVMEARDQAWTGKPFLRFQGAF